MADNQVTVMIGAFIAVAILLSVGVVILGNSTNNCSSLSGYNATTPSANETRYTHSTTATQTGWAAQCQTIGTQTINAYQLLGVVLIVIAAVVILTVIKYL